MNHYNCLRRSLASLILPAVVLWPVAGAHAQYTNTLTGSQFSNMYAANADFLMTQMIRQSGWQAMRNSISAQSAHRAASTGASAAKASPIAPAKASYAKPITASDFKPAGARNVPEQLAAQATSAKDRQQLVTAGREILKNIEATPGFRKNNLAAAMTVLLGVAIQVHYSLEIPDAESERLMREINDVVTTIDGFKTLSAEKRTLAYDTFIVVGGFIAGIAQHGAETGNAELTQQAKTMARDALLQFGVKV